MLTLSLLVDCVSAGFEPARKNPNRFLICRLNHSATTTSCRFRFFWTLCEKELFLFVKTYTTVYWKTRVGAVKLKK